MSIAFIGLGAMGHHMAANLLQSGQPVHVWNRSPEPVQALAAKGAKPAYVEGYDRSDWILLDYFDFIVHVFGRETRTFYDLERLWGSADRIEVT